MVLRRRNVQDVREHGIVEATPAHVAHGEWLPDDHPVALRSLAQQRHVQGGGAQIVHEECLTGLEAAGGIVVTCRCLGLRDHLDPGDAARRERGAHDVTPVRAPTRRMGECQAERCGPFGRRHGLHDGCDGAGQHLVRAHPVPADEQGEVVPHGAPVLADEPLRLQDAALPGSLPVLQAAVRCHERQCGSAAAFVAEGRVDAEQVPVEGLSRSGGMDLGGTDVDAQEVAPGHHCDPLRVRSRLAMRQPLRSTTCVVKQGWSHTLC